MKFLPMTFAHAIVRSLRLVKSEAEITKIRAACATAERAFARVGEVGQAVCDSGDRTPGQLAGLGVKKGSLP